MNAEHLTHRQIKVPDASPEPLAQLLERVQLALSEGRPSVDTIRWVHDSLALLTELFASFAMGALKTVGPYSPALEQLLKAPASLDRSERILAQAFIDWRSHPHHPAYESLRDAFFLTSRLQSSRTAPRRYTRWLGVEGRAVLGLEQLSRWSRRLDILASDGDGEWAQEQLVMYLPLLWIWTDALEGFFREWSWQIKAEVEGGKLSFSGTAKRDDIHLQLVSPAPLGALKANFLDDGGRLQLNGFAPPKTAAAVGDSIEAAPAVSAQTVSPVETDPVPALEAPVEEPDIALVYDEASGEYVISGGSQSSGVSEPDPVSSGLSSFSLDLSTPDEAPSFLNPTAEIPSPEFLPNLEEEVAAVEPEPPLSEAPVAAAPSVEAAAVEIPLFEVPSEPAVEEPVAEIPSPDFLPSLDEAASVEPEVPLFEAPSAAAVEEPVVEIPSPDFLPSLDEAASVEPETPLFEAPTFEPPAFELPVSEAPAAEVASVEAPAVEVPLFEAPSEPAVEEPVVEIPSPDFLPNLEEAAAAEPEAPVFEAPAVEAPTFEAPSVEPPVFEVPSAEAPAVEAPLFEAPSAPAVEEPVAEIPSPDFLPSLEETAAVEPETPLFEAPAVEVAVVEAPTFEAPSVEPPVFEAAEVEPQLIDVPSTPVETEVPLFEAPAVEASAPELPVVEAPEIAPPVLEAPAFTGPEPTTLAQPTFEEPAAAEGQVSSTETAPVPDLFAPSSEPSQPPFDLFDPASVLPGEQAGADLFDSAETAAEVLEPTVETPQTVLAPTLEVPVSAFLAAGEPAFSPQPAAEQPPEPTPLVVEAPDQLGATVAMGTQTEEVLDDNFVFSPDAGPSRPQWKGWGASERESVQAVCENSLGLGGNIPTAFATPVNAALESSANKIQIVLGSGCGKSHLARDLCVQKAHPHFGPSLLVEWSSVGEAPQGSGEEFLAFYFLLREDLKSRASGAILPEPETAAALAGAIPTEGFVATLGRLLGQLALLNRAGLTLVLDEPPESFREALSLSVPGRLRIVSLVSATQSSEALGDKVDLQVAWLAAAAEIHGAAASEYIQLPGANLLRVGLAQQLRAAGGAVPASLTDIVGTVLGHPSVDPDLLVCLGLEPRLVSLDDLDQWYLDSSKVQSSVKAFPSLFQLRSTRLSPALGLSHASVAAAVSANYVDLRGKIAGKLLGWTVGQLEMTSSDKYGSLAVRELVYRNFCRLYRYALQTGSESVLEWVARNKELQRNRVALTTHLEKPGQRWELQNLLTLLAQVLAKLVVTETGRDLRDEHAWALSNLGLNQYLLGLVGKAKADVEQALETFITLVEKERQNEFRPALATTCYRAARIADAVSETERAKTLSEKAVSELVELVEDRGRVDLQPRLGVAMALRGRLKGQAQDAAGALKDLQRASGLISTTDSDPQQDLVQTQIEVQLELAALMLKGRDSEGAARESTKAVQMCTRAVDELHFEDLQPLLATAHTSRARCFLEQGEIERAQRDLSKSITLRNLVVDEGRLDQRLDLAKEYLLRSQVDRGRGLQDDAARDLQRSVDLLEQLVGEGRQDAKLQLVQTLVERAEVGASGPAGSMADLQRALAVSQEDPSATAEAQSIRLSLLDGVLRASLRAGDFAQATAVSNELLTARQAAQDWDGYARVLVIRGDLASQQGQFAPAGENYQQAVSLLSRLMEQGQTDERLAMLADAYFGVGSIELKQAQAEKAQEPIRRALDLYTHLFQQRGQKTVLPAMLKAYSAFADIGMVRGKVPDAMAALKSAFDILGYLEKEGGASQVDGFELRKAELFRLRARAAFQAGDANSALHDSEEAMRNFLLDRQKNQQGPWKDELARTWILRSSIFFVLKDFAQAETSIQEAITHFEAQVTSGQVHYFQDLLKALSTRAENSAKAGKIDRVLEEYGRMLAVAAAVSQAGASLDMEVETAKILEKRARVYRDQGVINEAYADYDKVIAMYRKLLSERGRGEVASDLVKVHIERGEMIATAGHGDHAISDYSQAVEISKALLGQGQVEAAAFLAQALQKRADAYRNGGKNREALADLEGAVMFQTQLLQQKQDPESMGVLGRALLSQGSLLAGFSQVPQAAQSLDQAIGLFTNLVEAQNQRQFSSDLATALITRVSLTGDKTDPGLRQVLIRAVELVTQQAREGKPLARDFTIDCLRSVVELLAREDFDTVGDLIDAVLKLVELVVTDGKSSQDFVKLTDLLLAASAGLIDDRRTARRPHFLALACVSCNREIQMFGKNSLPRLVYCLYELGQALERSKPPSVLNYIGSSFALLGELSSQQQGNEDFLRDLKSMVGTWRSLPPQIPALANVSRHMLSQLLRLA